MLLSQLRHLGRDNHHRAGINFCRDSRPSFFGYDACTFMAGSIWDYHYHVPLLLLFLIYFPARLHAIMKYQQLILAFHAKLYATWPVQSG